MSPGAATTMARPKKGTRPGKSAGASTGDRTTVINLKGTVAYSEWLDQVHRRTHIPRASLFRIAMQEWAERNGHPAPPEF